MLGLGSCRFIAECGDEDDRGGPADLAQRLDNLQARADGHSHIGDDEVDGLFGPLRLEVLRNVDEKPPAVGNLGHVVPAGPKRLGQKPPELSVVLGEKHVVPSPGRALQRVQ